MNMCSTLENLKSLKVENAYGINGEQASIELFEIESEDKITKLIKLQKRLNLCESEKVYLIQASEELKDLEKQLVAYQSRYLTQLSYLNTENRWVKEELSKTIEKFEKIENENEKSKREICHLKQESLSSSSVQGVSKHVEFFGSDSYYNFQLSGKVRDSKDFFLDDKLSDFGEVYQKVNDFLAHNFC